MVGEHAQLLFVEFGFHPELLLECFVLILTKSYFLVGERIPSGKVLFLIR